MFEEEPETSSPISDTRQSPTTQLVDASSLPPSPFIPASRSAPPLRQRPLPASARPAARPSPRPTTGDHHLHVDGRTVDVQRAADRRRRPERTAGVSRWRWQRWQTPDERFCLSTSLSNCLARSDGQVSVTSTARSFSNAVGEQGPDFRRILILSSAYP